MEEELNAEHRTPNAERRTAAVTRIRARLLIPLALAVVFSALWVATLAGSQAWLVRAQARVDAAHAAAVPAEEGERPANALWRAEKTAALLRLVPTQFALEHFENAWINATPEEQERYILRVGLALAGIAGFVFGVLLAFWYRLRLPWRFALLALLLHPVLYCGTFAWSQRGSDSPAFWLLFQLARPYDALLAALSWQPAPTDLLSWRTDRAVLDGAAYVALACVLGWLIRRLRHHAVP